MSLKAAGPLHHEYSIHLQSKRDPGVGQMDRSTTWERGTDSSWMPECINPIDFHVSDTSLRVKVFRIFINLLEIHFSNPVHIMAKCLMWKWLKLVRCILYLGIECLPTVLWAMSSKIRIQFRDCRKSKGEIGILREWSYQSENVTGYIREKPIWAAYVQLTFERV